MAVSKRTRYEVLRRDDFTCRYCRSKGNELHVDHVTPVALGGTDKPANLVAACKDCNLGKASASPDSATLEHLDEQTIAYERARAVVVARETKRAKAKRKVYKQVTDAWEASAPRYAEMAPDWRATVSTWIGRGLSIERIVDAIEIASSKGHLPSSAVYPYACKIAWNWLTDLEDEIRAEATPTDAEEGNESQEYQRGYDAGWSDSEGDWRRQERRRWTGEILGGVDLRDHIDRRATTFHIGEDAA